MEPDEPTMHMRKRQILDRLEQLMELVMDFPEEPSEDDQLPPADE